MPGQPYSDVESHLTLLYIYLIRASVYRSRQSCRQSTPLRESCPSGCVCVCVCVSKSPHKSPSYRSPVQDPPMPLVYLKMYTKPATTLTFKKKNATSIASRMSSWSTIRRCRGSISSSSSICKFCIVGVCVHDSVCSKCRRFSVQSKPRLGRKINCDNNGQLNDRLSGKDGENANLRCCCLRAEFVCEYLWVLQALPLLVSGLYLLMVVRGECEWPPRTNTFSAWAAIHSTAAICRHPLRSSPRSYRQL